MRKNKHNEHHQIQRVGWLRAAVLGANDGIISISGLLIGVASAHRAYDEIIIAGIAGLIAGAMSMAAGEYISVSSQADSEKNDLERERQELATNHAGELDELTSIYIKRGVDKETAKIVATQLMAKDALAAHARDELGITEQMLARPIQAGVFSASSFTLGSIPLLVIVSFVSNQYLVPVIVITALLFLAILGALAAKIGGSKMIIGSVRVLFWGSLAMIVSAVIGSILGITV